MMETHVSCQEEEVRTLRQEIHALNLQAAEREEERRREVGDLSAQVEVHQHAAVSGDAVTSGPHVTSERLLLSHRPRSASS